MEKKELPKIVNGIAVPFEKSISDIEIMLDEEMPYFTVACIALASKSEKSSLELLKKLLSNNDWCKRRMVVEALEYHSLGHILAEDIMLLLDDKSKYVVKAVLKTISVHAINSARLKTLILLKSKDEEIRQEALSCLTIIGLEDDFDLICKLFEYEKSKHVKDEAAKFIRIRSSNVTWKNSVNLLKKSELARHRIWACELIGIYGDKADLNLLTEFQSDLDGHVRKIANKIIADYS